MHDLQRFDKGKRYLSTAGNCWRSKIRQDLIPLGQHKYILLPGYLQPHFPIPSYSRLAVTSDL